MKGVVAGWEGYVLWLVKQMRRMEGEGEGEGREEYVPVDEQEGRRLRGWA